MSRRPDNVLPTQPTPPAEPTPAVQPTADYRIDLNGDTSSPVPQPRPMSDRFLRWQTSPGRSYDESDSYDRDNRRYTDPGASLLNIERSPTETECTWAKVLCGVGGYLSSAGSTLFAAACWLGSEQLKDVGETHIVCCAEAIGGTACLCGACCLLGGAALAFKAKRG